jgi:hypothetical protein
MQELTTELAQQFDALAPAMERMPAAQARIEAFAEDAKARHRAAWQRVIHFTAMGWRRRTVARQTRMEIASRLRATTSETDRQRLLALESSVHHTLSSIQATAQFRTYERLFALWHVAHIPFLYMLAFTAAFHVLAVHM